jgi:hypothetical protein
MLTKAIVIVIIAFFISACTTTTAQTDTILTPENKFSTPQYNGAISFAINGAYSKATLENATWTFENLHFYNSQPIESLKVSAENSTIIIVSYLQSNFSSSNRILQLSYNVEGQGKQTFNLGLDSNDGEWSVIFNDVFMGEGDGWNLSPDATLTINGATGNVSLLLFRFPDSFGGGNNSDVPFYLQHSVAIATAIIVSITVIVTIAIRVRNKRHLDQSGLTTFQQDN